jgi:hypothetical protein
MAIKSILILKYKIVKKKKITEGWLELSRHGKSQFTWKTYGYARVLSALLFYLYSNIRISVTIKVGLYQFKLAIWNHFALEFQATQIPTWSTPIQWVDESSPSVIIGGSPSDGNGATDRRRSSRRRRRGRRPSCTAGTFKLRRPARRTPFRPRLGSMARLSSVPGNGRKQINITTLTGVTPLLVDRP